MQRGKRRRDRDRDREPRDSGSDHEEVEHESGDEAPAYARVSMAEVARRHLANQVPEQAPEDRGLYPQFVPLQTEPAECESDQAESEGEEKEEAAGVDVLANLVEASMKTRSRQLAVNVYPKPLRASHAGRVSQEVSSWADSKRTERGVFAFALASSETFIAMLLEAYGQINAGLWNRNVLRCSNLGMRVRALDSCFPLLELSSSVLGSLQIDSHQPEQVAQRLCESGIEVLTVARCTREDADFLARTWAALPADSRLSQIVLGLDQPCDQLDGVELWEPPSEVHPWWPHAAESSEVQAMMDLVRCTAEPDCGHARCVFRNRELGFVHEASLWKFPAWLSSKQCAAAVADPDIVRRAHLMLYRDCGDTRQLLTRVMPSAAEAKEVNAFYVATASAGRELRTYETEMESGAPQDVAAMELDDDEDETELPEQVFFPGMRVVLLVNYAGLRAASLGVVSALGDREVRVHFDAAEQIVAVGRVLVSLPGEKSLALIPLQAAFAVAASFLCHGEVGEMIACGLSPMQRLQACSILTSAIHFLWTPETRPEHLDDRFFSEHK